MHGFLNVDLNAPIRVKTLQKLASWASRYSSICAYMKPFASILHAEYAGRGEHVTVALSKRARFWGRNLKRGRPNISSNLDVVGVCASTQCDIFGFFAKAWNIPIIDCIFFVKRFALGRVNCNPKHEAKMEFILSYTLPPNHFHNHINALLDAFKDEGSLQKRECEFHGWIVR